ncbi:MAG: Gfo/Idh/MocA family oxidoreductase [Gemmataceae bacterium]
MRVAVIGVNGQGGGSTWASGSSCRRSTWSPCATAIRRRFRRTSGRFKTLKRQPRCEKDVRKLLEDKEIDAVSIATPNHWHALMAVWAMQAGKDVYVEKPCSHNVREGRVITQWARKLGRMCQMGVQSRSMPGMRKVLDFVKSGKLGKVSVARAICYRSRPSIGYVRTPAAIPAGLDFDLWCGPAPKVVPHRKRLHYDWHWFWATGNGDLGNQNPHELDKGRWGLGKQELPKRVVSLGGRLGYVDDAETANSQVTFFEWDDALLISDVRGLPFKSKVTFGLKGGPFQGARQRGTAPRATPWRWGTPAGWRSTTRETSSASGRAASTSSTSPTSSRPCAAATTRICTSTSRTAICPARGPPGQRLAADRQGGPRRHSAKPPDRQRTPPKRWRPSRSI